MEPTVLSVNALQKIYAKGFVLGPCTFAVEAGDTLAILGKNGAGKSTLFELISGNLDPSAGEVKIGAAHVRVDQPAIKRRFGYLPQHVHLPPWVTGLDVLRYAAMLHEVPRAEEAIQKAISTWDLADFVGYPIETGSHGMQKRVALALAHLHNPDYLILDEPFSGLDLYHIRALQQSIEERKTSGKITILSTHIAHFVAKLCQRVFVLDNGTMQEIPQWSGLEFLDKIQKIEERF